MTLQPPQPTDVWEDEHGNVWYEYSAHEIIQWELHKFIWGMNRQPMSNNRSSTGQKKCNLPPDIAA